MPVAPVSSTERRAGPRAGLCGTPDTNPKNDFTSYTNVNLLPNVVLGQVLDRRAASVPAPTPARISATTTRPRTRGPRPTKLAPGTFLP